jgi:hypothetical protein
MATAFFNKKLEDLNMRWMMRNPLDEEEKAAIKVEAYILREALKGFLSELAKHKARRMSNETYQQWLTSS